MNILPKKYSEFLDKKYWDNFFDKINKKSKKQENFEWYSEFPQFKEILLKLIKKENRFLNIGCGNSLFSEQLYEEGFKNIINVDFSEKTINDMQIRAKKRDLQGLNYQVMDIFKLTFENESFDIVLDKGTLDAVFPENTQKIKENVEILFQSIFRVLNKDGSYIFISLLQDFIANFVLNYFEKEYQVEVFELLPDNSGKMTPFLIKITKIKPNFIKIHYMNGTIAENNAIESLKIIKQIQLQTVFQKKINVCDLGQRFSLEIYDQQQLKNTPKYQLWVVDSKNKKILDENTCGCFITPQGKEMGFISSTEQGNFDLLEQSNLSRLIFIIPSPGHQFDSLKAIQDEINPVILKIIPKNCSNRPCPYMTDGDELGEKQTIFQNDELIIEDYKIESDYFRRLILTNNIKTIQSQFKLRFISKNSQNYQYLCELRDKYGSIYTDKKFCLGIDQSYLDNDSYRTINAALCLRSSFSNDEPKQVTILGGGGCALGKFLYDHYNNIKIINVEKSKAVIEFSRIFFDHQDDETFQMIHQDALKYVQENQQQNDVIIIDINSQDHEEPFFPDQQFLSDDFFQKIRDQLKPDGIFTMIINQTKEEKKKIISRLSALFHVIYVCELDDGSQFQIDQQSVVIALNSIFDQLEGQIIVDYSLIKNKKQMEQLYKTMVKGLKQKWDDTLNIGDYIKYINIEFPSNKNIYQIKNTVQYDKNNQLTSDTKEQYMQDLGKVNKKQNNRKKKNKVR